MITGVTKKSFTYESKLDDKKGTPEATKFKLKVLSARVIASLNDKSAKFKTDAENKETVTEFNGNSVNIDFVRFGLEGWENFKDEEGKDIVFSSGKETLSGKEYEVASDKSVDCLPYPLIIELAKVIVEGNTSKDTERKNSGK